MWSIIHFLNKSKRRSIILFINSLLCKYGIVVFDFVHRFTQCQDQHYFDHIVSGQRIRSIIHRVEFN